MTKRFDHDRHRKTMRSVPSRNSKHEVLLREFLASKGYIDETDHKGLPCTPDIVLSKQKTAIFMHGCYWHRHPGCRYAYDVGLHVENIDRWLKKFADNQARDLRQIDELLSLGWRVLVVWQCGINAKKRENIFLPQVLDWLKSEEKLGEIPQEPPLPKH